MPMKPPNRNGKSTETRPICKSSRVLYTIRLQISRPKLSVPSGWFGLNGGWKASSSRCMMGSYGVNSGAMMATAMTAASSSKPASRVGLSPTFCRRMRTPRRRTGTARGGARTCSLIGHARIEERVRQVHEEIHQDDQHRADDGDRLDDRIVAAGDGGKQQLPRARDGEDRLDHEGAADQEAKLQAENRHRREECVAQHVTNQHYALLQSLGARGADEIGRRSDDDLAAQVADEHC